jgi:hypothetical protein
MNFKKMLLVLITFSLELFASNNQENTKIEILKAKLVDNVSVVGIRQLKVTSDDLGKVMIKTKN